MTNARIDRIRNRHLTSPIPSWNTTPIRNSVFVRITDNAGEVTSDITGEDAQIILATHRDRGDLLDEIYRLRDELKEARHARALSSRRLPEMRKAHDLKIAKHALERTEWSTERRELETQLAENTAPDVLSAPYRAALGDLVNQPWQIRPVGGVMCAQSPWIAHGDLQKYQGLVAGVQPVPTRSGKRVGRRVNVDAA